MPAPSPDPNTQISSYINQLRQTGRREEKFLNQYQELLKTLAGLGDVTLTHKGISYNFSYLSKAADIKLDILAHKDNQSAGGMLSLRQGASTLDHLATLAGTVKDASTGAIDPQKAWVLREIITELAHPFTTTQDRKNTCAAEAISTQLMIDNPAEWTRVAIQLLTNPPETPIVSSLPGVCIKLPADIWTYDKSPERSPIAAAIQAAVKNSFAPEGWKYSNKDDKYTDAKKQEYAPGMDLIHAKAALEALLGREHILRNKESLTADWFKKAPDLGVYTVLKWNTQGKNHEYHAINVIGYDSQSDRVIFRNPHRQQDWPKGNDIPDQEGPARRSEDKETGLESMKLKDFLKRVEYCIPSKEALDMIEGGKEDQKKQIPDPADDSNSKNKENVPVIPKRNLRSPWFKVTPFKVFKVATGLGILAGGYYAFDNLKIGPMIEPAAATSTDTPGMKPGGLGPNASPAESRDRTAAATRPSIPTAETSTAPGSKPEEPTGGTPSPGGLTSPSTSPVETARTALGDKFFGVEQWERAFNRKVKGPADSSYEQVNKLLQTKCPIDGGGQTLRDTHQLFVVPEKLTFDDLLALCKEANITLEIAPGLNAHLPGAPDPLKLPYSNEAALAFLPREQWNGTAATNIFKGSSDSTKDMKMKRALPDYRFATIAETIISVVLHKQAGGEVRDFALMCADKSAHRRLCVGYKSEPGKGGVLRIGTDSDFSYGDLGAAVARSAGEKR